MRMMIIGDANSIWIKSVIENTIDTQKNEVLLISYSNVKYRTWYEQQGISVILVPKNNYGKLHTLVSAYQLRKQLKNECFDRMLIYFVDRGSMIIGLSLKALAKECVAAFMGSDVFRAKKSTILFLKYALRKFDRINITTDAMLMQFRKDYGNFLDTKITRARFGINGLDYLKKNISNLNQSYGFPEIPRDKIVIAVGYNGHQAQQHLKVIDELKKFSQSELGQIHLIFRMTYGGNSEYVEGVKAEVQKLGCTYSFYTEYLSDEETALLTCLTDLLIHAQVTDALSACMMEHLYAGVQVFNPTWLSYLELQDPSVHYNKYRSFEEMGQLVRNNLIKKETYCKSIQLEQMRAHIEKLASWECLKSDWQKAYNGKS